MTKTSFSFSLFMFIPPLWKKKLAPTCIYLINSHLHIMSFFFSNDFSLTHTSRLDQAPHPLPHTRCPFLRSWVWIPCPGQPPLMISSRALLRELVSRIVFCAPVLVDQGEGIGILLETPVPNRWFGYSHDGILYSHTKERSIITQ